MKIVKFKKMPRGRYKITLDTAEEFVVYEDIIFKYDLLIKKDITLDKLEGILDDNRFYDAYNLALSYIEYKLRSKKEIEEYLDKKEFPHILIDNVINEIEKLGYIDDRRYTKAFINDKLNFTNHGPFKIKNELLNNGIDENIIDEELKNIDNSIFCDKLYKIIEKKEKTNDKPLNIFKSKMANYLYNLGYSNELINSSLLFDKDDFISEEILNKIVNEKNKLYKKYEKKYDDSKLDYQVMSALYRKGYSKDIIDKVMEHNEY